MHVMDDSDTHLGRFLDESCGSHLQTKLIIAIWILIDHMLLRKQYWHSVNL